jgi:hypothetical protein
MRCTGNLCTYWMPGYGCYWPCEDVRNRIGKSVIRSLEKSPPFNWRTLRGLF